MFEIIAFILIVSLIIVYYETRIARINKDNVSLVNQWIAYAESLETELDRIYGDYCDIKLNYGNAVVSEKIATGKIKARKVEGSKVHAIALPGFTLPNGDHELKFANDGTLIFERKPEKTEDKSKDNGNKNQPAKTEAKSELFEHKDYQTVVNQLGGTVSDVESKSINNQLTKGNAIKDIVSNIKKWRENNAKKIANNK